MELLPYILTGGAAAAVIKLIETITITNLHFKHNQKMNVEKEIRNLIDFSGSVTKILRLVLHDRIKYLARYYIQDGEISYDDREDLINMHDAYHNDLGGNGNLDYLMRDVKALPLEGKGGGE